MDSPKYQEVFYTSGNLRIQAYLYKPDGDGPFPVVIYNHGTRNGRERASFPFPHVGKMLTRAGYAVLVPERRGYGKSDGEIWWQEAGRAAPGHALFSSQGASLWESDVIEFLGRYLK